VLTKEGKPFAVTLLTYPERAELPPTAEVIQSQLKEVGIHVEVKVLQVDAAFDLRNSGEFDMYLVGRGLLFVPDPDDNLMQDYHSKGTFGRGWGAYRYRNPALDRLLEWGRQTFDPAARKKIYDEIQRILVKDAPVAYLSYYVNVDATRATVVNYLMHPIEHRFRLEQVDLR
jgi:peptide/nickel transport system substrate-binding protein